MAVKEKTEISRARFPEQVGIDSNEIKALINDFEENGVELHSMMILRHGKVAYESWRDPYNAQTPHTMYSVSKSFVSTAIGFAIDEGVLTLDTKVIDIFPEYRPKKFDEKLESMTVYHLLTMTAGKDVSLISDKTKDTWVKDFFNSKWAFAPGEGWRYISENTYMCCAIIHRLTGQSVREYLTPRLFEPLGFKRVPFWETDPHGVEAGGWGLFITTDELARFTLCYQQKGVYAGKQIIPEWWVEQATKKCVENQQYADSESCCGYGCFFWRCVLENTYRADGMFSQFGYVFGDYDASLIITASEITESTTRECIARHFPQMFTDNRRKEPEGACRDLELTPLPVLPAKERSLFEKIAEGRILHFPKNPVLNVAGWPLSMLPVPVTYMSADKGGNIDNVVLHFFENECTMTWDEGKEHNTIVCGMDGAYRKSPIRLAGIDFTAVSSAAWEDDNTLEIWMRPLESICERRIKLCFNGNNVKLVPESAPSLLTMAEYLSGFAEAFIPNQTIADIGKKVLLKLDKVLEFPMFGSMI